MSIWEIFAALMLIGIVLQVRNVKKEQNKNKNDESSHFSEVILITCGDYRVAAFVRKYIKRMHQWWEMDILTTAGGARTITMSVRDISMGNFLFSLAEYIGFLFKKIALWIDFAAYYSHDAEKVVIANHKFCAKCPKFESDEAEDGFHIKTLIRAREIVKKKYPKIREIILLYVIIDKETHEASKVIEISPTGEIKTIIISEEEKLAFKENELKMLKNKEQES